MIWIAWVLGGLIAVVAAVYVVGMALPAEHVARETAMIAAPPDRVAALVRTVQDQPRWRRGVTAIELGARHGDALDYVEVSGGDRIAFRFEEAEADRRFTSTITDDTLPFGGSWTIALAPEGPGTRVTIEERGIVRNPVFRFVSTVIIGHSKTIADYLADLAKAAAQPIG